MEILYIISLIFLMITFFFKKKTDNKLDSIAWILITIVCTFCYNTFVSYVLTFFMIPITLVNLAIINIIIAIILLIIILRKKQIQKYCFKKIDILYLILLFIAVLIVSYLNFGFSFNIKYETGDPSVHYLTAQMFSESDQLLVEQKDDVYGGFSARKPVSYVNTGLMMKCLNPVMDSFDSYNIFICFGIFILFLSAWSMYSLIRKFAKDNKMIFIAFIVTLLYTMGYPLNSMLFGFEYLSMGILILSVIVHMAQLYEKEDINISTNLIVFFMLNFGLFMSYYMFVPFVYSALWIYFCMCTYKKEKTIFKKKNILLLIITLLIPFGFGYIYTLAPNIYSVFINQFSGIDKALNYTNHIINKGLAVYGYIYVNLYSNMLLLLPIPCYLIYKKFKENKLETLMLAFVIIFIEVLLIGFLFGKVSIYYLSKNYFALWFILFYMNYKGLALLYEKDKKLPFIITGFYIMLIVSYLLLGHTNVENRELNTDERINTVVEVYGANKTIIKEKQVDFYKNELEILKYAKDNLDYNKQIEILGRSEQVYWAYPILGYVNDTEESEKHGGQNKLTFKLLNIKNEIGKVDYIIYFNRTWTYNKYKDKLFENAEIIYENESGGIVKYNN